MKSKKAKGFLALFILLLLLVAWTLWGNTAIELHREVVESDAFPEAFSGYKIAQVSDLHNAELGEDNEKVLSLLREAKPDIIVITGDLIDAYDTDVEEAAAFAEEAMRIAPCYFVTGNHEAWAGAASYEKMEEALLSLGVTVLHNQSVNLTRNGETISLIGVDDPSFIGLYMSAEEMKELGNGAEYQILLAHRPELFSTYVEAGVDLVFSGHAHGGQFRLPFVGGLVAPDQGFFPEYDAGLYTKDGTTMMVSRGIGNSIIPIRFNNRPEVVLIELRKADWK